MNAICPTYLIDTNDPTDVHVNTTGRCHVRFGTLALVFDSAVEAEAALDEAQLALRLLTVGGEA